MSSAPGGGPRAVRNHDPVLTQGQPLGAVGAAVTERGTFKPPTAMGMPVS